MKLRDCLISEQSHTVLDGLGHEVVGLHLAVERKLASIGDPEISWHMETGETGFLRALAGKRRDLLVIEHKSFPEYSVLIAARAHGSVLHVAWMVLVSPRLVNDLKRAFRIDAEPGTRFEIGAEHDAIDVMDLRAFVGITSLALKNAIRELTDQEPEQAEESRDIDDFG